MTRNDRKHRYYLTWGNFKSDKWKSKRTLRTEIRDILGLMIQDMSKKDLIEIKDLLKNKAEL